MIYPDACALLSFIKLEKETGTLRAWRTALPEGTELVSSELTRLEITRTLLRADPFRPELTDLITYDMELARAAEDLGFPVRSPT